MANVLVNENNLQNIADAIREKNGTTTLYKPSEMTQAILEINSGTDSTALAHFIERTESNVVIPEGVSRVADYVFYNNTTLKNIVFSDSVKTIGTYAFYKCNNVESLALNKIKSFSSQAFYQMSGLKSIDFGDVTEISGSSVFGGCTSLERVASDKITSLGYQVFSSCTGLLEVDLKNLTQTAYGTFYGCSSLNTVNIPKVQNINSNCFTNCVSLKTLFIPNTLITAHNTTFNGCTALEFVTLEEGFNCNFLNLSASTLYSAETIVSWLEALADRTGLTAYTLTIGSANLAKLSEEQIAIATSKNWNLA